MESISEEIRKLKSDGLSISQIARKLDISYQKSRYLLDKLGLSKKFPKGEFVPSEKKEVSYEISEKGCHICTSHACSSGYPIFCREGKKVRIGRYLYIQRNGPIREGLHILHKCDNKLCVNVEHLELGTIADNTKDFWDRIGFRGGLRKKEVIQIFLSGKTTKDLMGEYDVSRWTINDIRGRRTWRSLTEKLKRD